MFISEELKCLLLWNEFKHSWTLAARKDTKSKSYQKYPFYKWVTTLSEWFRPCSNLALTQRKWITHGMTFWKIQYWPKTSHLFIFLMLSPFENLMKATNSLHRKMHLSLYNVIFILVFLYSPTTQEKVGGETQEMSSVSQNTHPWGI